MCALPLGDGHVINLLSRFVPQAKATAASKSSLSHTTLQRHIKGSASKNVYIPRCVPLTIMHGCVSRCNFTCLLLLLRFQLSQIPFPVRQADAPDRHRGSHHKGPSGGPFVPQLHDTLGRVSQDCISLWLPRVLEGTALPRHPAHGQSVRGRVSVYGLLEAVSGEYFSYQILLLIIFPSS